MSTTSDPNIRHDWTLAQVQALFALPFNDLLFQAHSIHRRYFDPNCVQLCTLLSIKTGACPEDCKYCSQSSRYDTGLTYEKLMDVEAVIEQAKAAKAAGATRFCMAAAWRSPKERDMPALLTMVKTIKAMELETCVSLGMLNDEQAHQLADAGLDYYNHNLDTSSEFYNSIITTRSYQDRLDTLQRVSQVGIKVCSGGIVGMGETVKDRAGMLMQLANLPAHPQSVPVNRLVRVAGTPLGDIEEIDDFDFIRTIAVAKLLMPRSTIRLSAGRETMSDTMHALAYFAGAGSIFYGETLLTTPNPETDRDLQRLSRLGIKAQMWAENEQNVPAATYSQLAAAQFYDAMAHG